MKTRQNHSQGQAYLHVGYVNHRPLHRSWKGHCAKVSPVNTANLRVNRNLVRSIYSVSSHLAASRKGRRSTKRLQSTERTNYMSGALPMLFYLTYVYKGILAQVHSTRVPPSLRAQQRSRHFGKSSAVAPVRGTVFWGCLLTANDWLKEPLERTGF